jgi:putative transposase
MRPKGAKTKRTRQSQFRSRTFSAKACELEANGPEAANLWPPFQPGKANAARRPNQTGRLGLAARRAGKPAHGAWPHQCDGGDSADVLSLEIVQPNTFVTPALPLRRRPHRRADGQTDSSYVSADLAKWLNSQNMEHVRGAPYHPMTQGKIERWHQTLKNRILLENYYLPGDLEAQIAAFVADYNHLRYHESISNLTPADVYFGRGQTILIERERIKRQTIANRRLLHRRQVA